MGLLAPLVQVSRLALLRLAQPRAQPRPSSALVQLGPALVWSGPGLVRPWFGPAPGRPSWIRPRPTRLAQLGPDPDWSSLARPDRSDRSDQRHSTDRFAKAEELVRTSI